MSTKLALVAAPMKAVGLHTMVRASESHSSHGRWVSSANSAPPHAGSIATAKRMSGNPIELNGS
jgi:hypothetical protein